MIRQCIAFFSFITSIISAGLIFIIFLASATSLNAQGVPPQVVKSYTQLVLEYESLKTTLNQNSINLQSGVTHVILERVDPELTLHLPDSAQQAAILSGSYNIVDNLSNTHPLQAGDTLFLYNNMKSVFVATSETAIDSGTIAIQFKNTSLENISINFPIFKFYNPWFKNVSDLGEITPQEKIEANTGAYTKVNILAHSLDAIGADTISCSAPICAENTLVFVTKPGSKLSFHANPYEAALDSIPVINGFASFYVYSLDSTTDEIFSLQGDFDPNNNARLTYTHSTGVTITLSPVPLLDKAEMFDTDGDAIGDSLAISYQDTILTQLPDTLSYNWPIESGATQITSDDAPTIKQDDPQTLVVEKNFATYPLSNQNGVIHSIYVLDNGSILSDEITIEDRIGPIISQATLIQSHNTTPDTLYVNFSEELQESAYSGDMFTLNNSTPLNTTGTILENGTWRFIIPETSLTTKDLLTLNPQSGITDTHNNPPSILNNGIMISTSPALPPITEEGGAFHDNNADGTMDSITILFSDTITPDMLNHSEFNFTWPGDVSQITTIYGTDAMIINPNNPREIYLIVPSDTDIKKQRTFIDSSYGTATITNIYTSPATSATFSDTTVKTLSDNIAPIVLSTHIIPALEPHLSDVVKITMSEEISEESLALNHVITISSNGIIEYPLTNLSLTHNNRVIQGDIAKDVIIDQRSNPGDTVTITEALFNIYDLNNNLVGDGSTVLTGGHRISAQHKNFARLPANSADLMEKEAITEEFLTDAEVESFLNNDTQIGYLLDLTMGFPENTEESFDLGDIYVSFEIFFFTTDGQKVVDKQGTIRCDDERFDYNCFENPRQILINWNYKSEDGRYIASGIYLSQLSLTIVTPEKSSTVQYIKKCGVMREREAYSFN
ncbi:MAG: hypothetical protein OCD76_16970 [Reichenbachiella sp.]